MPREVADRIAKAEILHALHLSDSFGKEQGSMNSPINLVCGEHVKCNQPLYLHLLQIRMFE